MDTKAVEGESSVEGGKRLLKEQCSIAKFIKERLDRIYEYQVLDRLPDFMDAVANGSQDDYLESNVPDGVQESLAFSVLKQLRN